MKNSISHAIILAAGLGTRLKPISDHSPKCLTEVNGKPILANTLQNLAACGVTHCTIVTGYLAEKITAVCGNSKNGVRIRYTENEIYRKTNDMYSLWLAREVLEKGALILEGDIFFFENTLKAALRDMGDRSFYLAGRYTGKPDEVAITTDLDKKVRTIEVLRGGAFLKESEVATPAFMSSGMLAIRHEYGRSFSRWLSSEVEAGNTNILFDDVISMHTAELPLYVYEIGDSDWVEIDTKEDLARAETIFTRNGS
ncbi:MAG: phosphocholine cytidylyltransferase family protein [Spirochaetes bacterium]|nr:phosphocholine cytidylyltransferase family protein [Spirochaetota bacterium]